MREPAWELDVTRRTIMMTFLLQAICTSFSTFIMSYRRQKRNIFISESLCIL